MRILLIRTSALGDIVHCLPVLTALRRHSPHATVGWVVEEAMAPLLQGHADLDLVIPVQLRPWRRRAMAPRTVAGVFRFVRSMRRFSADVALDLMGNHKAGVIARLSGATTRVGLAAPHRREPSSGIWLHRGVEPLGQHAVERALSVLAALRLPFEPADFGGSKIRPDAVLPASASVPRDLVLLHAGAGWANKIYPSSRWADVAKGLAAAGLSVRIAFGPGEKGLADEIEAASEGAAEPVAAGDLTTLIAWTRASRLFLGGDTGPVHLAHALGTPALALMGPTNPAMHGPYGSPSSALAVQLPCSFCYKRMDGPRACLLAISPSMVVKRALELLR